MSKAADTVANLWLISRLWPQDGRSSVARPSSQQKSQPSTDAESASATSSSNDRLMSWMLRHRLRRAADDLGAVEIQLDFALVFPIFGALATVPGATAGRLDEQDLLIAFPVEHCRLRIELVVELCGQRPGVRGALVGDDGRGHGGRVSDCQLHQSRLVGLQDAGPYVDVFRTTVAHRRPAVLRGRQRALVCARTSQRLVVGGLQPVVGG